MRRAVASAADVAACASHVRKAGETGHARRLSAPGRRGPNDRLPLARSRTRLRTRLTDRSRSRKTLMNIRSGPCYLFGSSKCRVSQQAVCANCFIRKSGSKKQGPSRGMHPDRSGHAAS